MNKINYQILMDSRLDEIVKSGKTPSLLLHACCAPCSSYVLEYLADYFRITIFYYNPNTQPEEEFAKRGGEFARLLGPHGMQFKNKVELIMGNYEGELFEQAAAGLEGEPEGGGRCPHCFRLRLSKTAELAKKEKFDCFATTLTVSPHKNAQLINSIGEELGKEYGVEYLCSDFKKRGGYLRSIQLSEMYGLYRQSWCGCMYSVRK